MASPVQIAMVGAMGGTGVPVAWGELYNALQTGVVDGAENNPPTLYNHKHYEIANHYSLTHHLIVPEIFVFSKKVWDTMSPLDQQLIRKASALTVEKVRDLWAKKEAGDFANLAKVGVKVNEVANKAPFIKATQVVRDNFAKKGDSFKKIIAAVAAVK